MFRKVRRSDSKNGSMYGLEGVSYMNFIFISPGFPDNYQYFCKGLKRNGVNVLGISDMPYDQLSEELKECLTEYYRVEQLECYDQVLRAVGFFTFKYGKIDWIESNNEYWLEQDARLRTDFHVTTGFLLEDMEKVKKKSKMKEYYEKANVLVAPYHLVTTWEEGQAFIQKVQYPVIVKPNRGVGANHTFLIENDSQLKRFYKEIEQRQLQEEYIMEPFIKGEICSYDAIIGQDGIPLLETGNITPISIMDAVNEQKDIFFYIVPKLADDIKEIGRNCVKAFGVERRFVHLEFFRLLEDQEGVGKKGQIVGLEVNMRPPGGYIPDMMNYSMDIDVYQCWADMVVFNQLKMQPRKQPYFCVYVGRRGRFNYAYDYEDIWKQYSKQVTMVRELPEVLAHGMGEIMYVARFEQEGQMHDFISFLLKKKELVEQKGEGKEEIKKYRITKKRKRRIRRQHKGV